MCYIPFFSSISSVLRYQQLLIKWYQNIDLLGLLSWRRTHQLRAQAEILRWWKSGEFGWRLAAMTAASQKINESKRPDGTRSVKSFKLISQLKEAINGLHLQNKQREDLSPQEQHWSYFADWEVISSWIGLYQRNRWTK